MSSDLTVERLREVINYDPETGIFTWRIQKGRIRPGTVSCYAGGRRRSPHIQIQIDKKPYTGSRLAWLYMTGSWPVAQIDHINFNTLDNRWCNLREATHSQNTGHRRLLRNNTSGYTGVWRKGGKSKKWTAEIRHNGQRINFGLFNNKEDAATVRDRVAQQLRGEFYVEAHR